MYLEGWVLGVHLEHFLLVEDSVDQVGVALDLDRDIYIFYASVADPVSGSGALGPDL